MKLIKELYLEMSLNSYSSNLLEGEHSGFSSIFPKFEDFIMEIV
jgi:hypothetical protein